MTQIIITILNIIWFFLSKWSERDKEKREKDKEFTDEIKSAFQEPNPAIRASRLNAITVRLRAKNK